MPPDPSSSERLQSGFVPLPPPLVSDVGRPYSRAAMSCRLASLTFAATLGACASVQQVSCTGAEQALVQEVLYFGTARPVGVVTPMEWAEFLRDTVTPRFPQGLTSWQASGQWRSTEGTVVQEASYVLHIVHPIAESNEKAIQELVAAYRKRFQQEAVLRVKAPACVSF